MGLVWWIFQLGSLEYYHQQCAMAVDHHMYLSQAILSLTVGG